MFVLQGQFNGLDLLGRTVGEIGNGTVLDLTLVTIGFAEQNSGINFAADANAATIEVY